VFVKLFQVLADFFQVAQIRQRFQTSQRPLRWVGPNRLEPPQIVANSLGHVFQRAFFVLIASLVELGIQDHAAFVAYSIERFRNSRHTSAFSS